MPTSPTTPYAILGMLRQRPRSGYEIRKDLAAAAGTFWSESYGQIYPALRGLARRGWAKRLPDPRGARGPVAPGRAGGPPGARAPRRRKRIVYEITPRGVEALEQWLSEPPRAAPPRHELLLKLYFGDRDRVDAPAAWVKRLLAEETERLHHVRRMIETLPRGAHPHRSLRHWTMALEFVAQQSEATVAWARRTLATLDLMQEAAARRRTASQRRSPME
ncbi:MAG TPA: PadR family transcriptional regulator [Acidobacteriota bacterium]|nr:PadR family transcriptional regulator [Acidobacteriota bacterium]